MCALSSPTCLFKNHIVITAEERWVGLASPPVAAEKGFGFVAADDFSHTVYIVVNGTGVTQQAEKADFCLFSLMDLPCPLLWCPISTFPGRWAVRWWWTPTPFAGRRNAWPGNRPSSARLSRRSSERWLKGPGLAWGSANTSLGTADGTARATTSISEKYCNKVSDDRVEWFYLVNPLCYFHWL